MLPVVHGGSIIEALHRTQGTQMTICKTHYRDGNFDLIGDPDANPLPRRFTVFLNGQESIVFATEGEGQLQVWSKVLGHLQWRRTQAKKANTRTSPNALATIYAGELTEESLNNARVKHLRQYCVEGLQGIANNPKTPASVRVRAYKLLLKLKPIVEES